MHNPLPKLYTTPEVMEIFGVTRLTVYRWIKSGKIEALKIGKDWRFFETAIERRKRERENG